MLLTDAFGLATLVGSWGLFEAGPEYPLQLPSQTLAVAEAVFRPQLSDNGRYALFSTLSDELDPGDSNGQFDIYRLDRLAGLYLRISISGGVQGDRAAVRGSLSADGQAVTFHSASDNLVAGDNNGTTDIFFWHADGGPDQILEQISLNNAGEPGNGGSTNASVSGDGRWVAFQSAATNLVENDNNNATDIFVRDRLAAATTRVSVSSSGVEGDQGSFLPSISDNGRYIAFTSEASNFSDNEFDQLPDLFVHDRSTGITELVNVSSSGVRSNADSAVAVISPDGSAVAFYSRATTLEPGVENIFFDIFVRDLLSRRTDLISGAQDEPANGNSFNPALSARGQWVAFQSEATNLSGADGNSFTDIYVVNRTSGESHIASRRAGGTSANSSSFTPSIAADGTLVAFESLATDLDNLGTGNPAGFLAAGASGAVSRLAVVPPVRRALDDAVLDARLSASGRYVTLISGAQNLLPGDANGQPDGFIIDQSNGQVRLLSRGAGGSFVAPPNAAQTLSADVSSDGCRSVVASAVDGALVGVNPALSDNNGLLDVFLRDDCQPVPPQLASVSAAGATSVSQPAFEPKLSDDGQWLVFLSAASELQDSAAPSPVTQLYRRGFDPGQPLELVSRVGNTGAAFPSHSPDLSADGAVTVFVSADPDLDPSVPASERPAPGQDQVYRYDAGSGQIRLLSRGLSALGNEAPNGASFAPTVSADGEVVAFVSRASNLTDPAVGSGDFIYVWQANPAPGAPAVVPLSAAGIGHVGGSLPVISADGAVVMFLSDNNQLAANDNNGAPDVFAVDRQAGVLLTVSRDAGGALRPQGAVRPVGISQRGSEYVLAYLAAEGGSNQLLLQPAARLVPRLTVDQFVSSPLQSVERGLMRLQVRNEGAVSVTASQGLTVTLDPLEHPLVSIANTPRWSCLSGPPVSCQFVGDNILGEELPPGGAELLPLEFDMFAGGQPLVSVAGVSVTMTDGAALMPAVTLPATTLVTQRVESGVFWQPRPSPTLQPGQRGESTVSVINGGQVPVSVVEIDLAPLVLGEPYHQFVLAPDAPWQCESLVDEELPPLTRRCTYTGPPIAPTEEVLLTSELTLPPGTGRLQTRVGLVSEAEVISPASLQLMLTEVDDLLFRSAFEGR